MIVMSANNNSKKEALFELIGMLHQWFKEDPANILTSGAIAFIDARNFAYDNGIELNEYPDIPNTYQIVLTVDGYEIHVTVYPIDFASLLKEISDASDYVSSLQHVSSDIMLTFLHEIQRKAIPMCKFGIMEKGKYGHDRCVGINEFCKLFDEMLPPST